jgi:hypothetical protein
MDAGERGDAADGRGFQRHDGEPFPDWIAGP